MLSGSEVNLVVGYTPYHHMFTSRFLGGIEGKTYCFYTAKDSYTRIRNSEIGFSYRSKNIMGLISLSLSVIIFAIFFHLLVVCKFKINVYLPHASHFLGNHLFFSRFVSDVYVYEDGILNYYDAQVGRRRVSIIKRLLSWLLLMPYSLYRGHLIGFDERSVSGAYLSRPQHAVRRDKIGKIEKVDCIQDDIVVRNGIVLFLDQKVSNRLTLKEFERYKNMLQEFISSGNYTAYYKPHHEYNDYVKWKSFMKPIDKKISCVPAEKVVEILRPELVISFFSSALINVRQTFPSVKCLALAPDVAEISRNGRATTLSELFIEADVRVLPLEAKVLEV